MKKILVFPTWILVILLQPRLPEGHVLKNRKITLSDWANGSNNLNIAYSIFFGGG